MVARHLHPIEADLFPQQRYQGRPGIGRIQGGIEHELTDIRNRLKEEMISCLTRDVTVAPHIAVEYSLVENRNKIARQISSVRCFKTLVNQGFLPGNGIRDRREKWCLLDEACRIFFGKDIGRNPTDHGEGDLEHLLKCRVGIGDDSARVLHQNRIINIFEQGGESVSLRRLEIGKGIELVAILVQEFFPANGKREDIQAVPEVRRKLKRSPEEKVKGTDGSACKQDPLPM